MSVIYGLGFLVLAFYILIRLFSSLVAGVFGSRHRVYRRIAARYRGKYEHRGHEPACITFPHQNTTVRIGLAPVVPGQPDKPRTRAIIQFASPLPLRMELYSRKRASPRQAPKNTRDVPIPQPAFDSTYKVLSNDPELTSKWLEPQQVRENIDTLSRLCLPDGALLSMNSERLLIQVDRDLGTSFQNMDTLVRVSLELWKSLESTVQTSRSQGINLLEPEDNPQPLEAPGCKVCGDRILGDHVCCQSCGIPCHSDCWTFVGGCSTFGCQSKQCLKVRGSWAGAPPPPPDIRSDRSPSFQL